MKLKPLIRKIITATILAVISYGSVADEIRVAVASNFSSTIKVIVERFELESGHKVKLSFGSTGKHYAQIINGAPFDIFFAADSRRPKLLEDSENIVSGTRKTYAVGRLVLWSENKDLIKPKDNIMHSDKFRRLAIANPKLAPYGSAAKEVMEKEGVWIKLSRRIIRGENISQTLQFLKSGNVDLGFIAYSQVLGISGDMGSHWLVPKKLYTPIRQQVVLLKDKPAARMFLKFIDSTSIREFIKKSGYGVGDNG
jgi:molybdate transport system substrate-binding protein